MSGPSEEGKEALQWILDEGHFDHIRKQVLESLRNNEDLKQFTTELLEKSKTIEQADLQQSNKKKILDDLRKELEEQLLDKASKTAYSTMTDPDNSICTLIETKVHEALCAIYEQKRTGQQPKKGAE